MMSDPLTFAEKASLAFQQMARAYYRANDGELAAKVLQAVELQISVTEDEGVDVKRWTQV